MYIKRDKLIRGARVAGLTIPLIRARCFKYEMRTGTHNKAHKASHDDCGNGHYGINYHHYETQYNADNTGFEK
ncbi:proliferating cell nuclear antigen [Faustovirus]|nr:proliferating cell nuclear antigen [Faustovirus]